MEPRLARARLQGHLKREYRIGRGSFVGFSGEDLEAEAKCHGAKGTAAGWVRDLRDDIMETLRNQAGIISGHKDIILSGESGYRLSDLMIVQFADPPTITDITDTDGANDVPNDDVPNDDVRNVFDVRDDAAGLATPGFFRNWPTGGGSRPPMWPSRKTAR